MQIQKSTCSFIGQVDFCNSCDEGQNYQMKETRGGKRQGSGRPKGNEATKVVSFRLPISVIPEIKEQIKNYLAHRIND